MNEYKEIRSGTIKSAFIAFIIQFFISTFFIISMAAGSGCSGGGGGGEIPGRPAEPAVKINKVYGICFSPYMDGQAPGQEISEVQIIERLRLIAPYTEWIRTYGCSGGLEKTGRAAKKLGLKTALGAWIGPDAAANEVEIANLIAAALKGEADIVIIGNETLSGASPSVTEERLINYIRRVRAAVPPSVTVTCAEGAEALLAHPAVIDECGAVFVQIHPYWGGIPVERAVADLSVTYEKVKAAAGGKNVVLSEAGWPDGGAANGAAAPSPENASLYLKNLVAWSRANKVEAFIFSAYDEAWKAGTEPNSVGSHWGLFYANGTLKPYLIDIFDGGGSL